jgi:hypothetical protein
MPVAAPTKTSPTERYKTTIGDPPVASHPRPTSAPPAIRLRASSSSSARSRGTPLMRLQSPASAVRRLAAPAGALCSLEASAEGSQPLLPLQTSVLAPPRACRNLTRSTRPRRLRDYQPPSSERRRQLRDTRAGASELDDLATDLWWVPAGRLRPLCGRGL